jgi:hypothetical protein
MSITLTNHMFSRLSSEAQSEIISSFQGSQDSDNGIDTSSTLARLKTISTVIPSPWKPSASTPVVSSAFDSASLSFSQPLTLPSFSDKGGFDLKRRVIRHATKVPVAIYSDIYSLKSPDEIDDIISDIDLGYFVGPSSWARGQKHHPENFDVRRVIQVIRSSGSANSYTINMALMMLCRTRIAAILRQLKIQGIVKVTPAN